MSPSGKAPVASVARPGGMTVTSAARMPGRAVRSPRAPAPAASPGGPP